MNQNLMWTLSRKYPNANSFEEAVAMEVESIEKDKQAVEDQLNELANKESALRMRVRELDFAKEQLGIQPASPSIGAHALPSDVSILPPAPLVTVQELPAGNWFEARRRTPSGGRPTRTRQDGETEGRYDSYNYAKVAGTLRIGTSAGTGVVWLTVEEHAAVRKFILEREAQQQPIPAVPPITLDGEVPSQAMRIRAGTSTEEQFHCGKHFLQISTELSIGTKAENGVWLTKEEYATVLQTHNAARTAARRENRDSRIRGGSGSVIERKYTSREYRYTAEKNKRGTHDANEADPCVWLTDQEADEVYLLVFGRQSANAK